jgi:hypothetical protein
MPEVTDWTETLVEQLDWHWNAQLRPRLNGLTDDEYFWEPVPDCWSVRPRGTGSAPIQAGTGAFTIDYSYGGPFDAAPVTTIAWRLAHVIVGVFGDRAARHFGAPAMSYLDFDYAGSADAALAQLDQTYADWSAGLRALTPEQFSGPCGEPGYEQHSYANLVLHINREAIHHGAEVALLRDLYAHRT